MEHTKFENKENRATNLRYYLFLACVMLGFVIFFQPIRVQGSSMEKTLFSRDLLLMIRNCAVDKYEAGDIIVVAKDQFNNGEFIIKRIVAVEGQAVNIDDENGIVYVDGIALDEPYASTLTYTNDEIAFPLTVDEDCYFVLGDNREESIDSRYSEIGQVHKDKIQGKIIWLLLPGMGDDRFDFKRIGTIN